MYNLKVEAHIFFYKISKKREMDNTVDRISDLPLPIIHLILTRLSMKDLFLTSLLSKTWKNTLYATFPIFDFNQIEFMGKELSVRDSYYLLKNQPEKFCNSIEDFSKFIHYSLLRFSQTDLHMQRFKLSIGIVDAKFASISPRLDNWIGFAVEHHVKEFSLHVYFRKGQENLYALPNAFFLSKSLTDVRLTSCELKMPDFASDSTFTFHCLENLCLESVILDGQMIEKLISGSPLLEIFYVKTCSGFKHCRVPKHRRLKAFAVSVPPKELQSIEIHAPNLLLCDINHEPDFCGRRRFTINMAECGELRTLSLEGISLISDQELRNFLSRFPLLEQLTLALCYSFKRFAVSSEKLKHLWIEDCEELEEITIKTPNLVWLCFLHKEVPVIHSINAPCPWYVGFLLNSVDDEEKPIDTLQALTLKSFLQNSTVIQHLDLQTLPVKDSFDLEEFRKKSPSPPVEVHDLCLYLLDIPDKSFLDSLFAICHPRRLCVRTKSKDENELIEWLYDKLWRREEDCCGFCELQCWRHSLKEVEIEKFEADNPENFELDLMSLSHEALMDAWPNLPQGDIHFNLKWCSASSIK